MRKAIAVVFLAALVFTGWRLAGVGPPAPPMSEDVNPVVGRFTAIAPFVDGVWLGDQFGRLVRVQRGHEPLSWVAHGGPIRRLELRGEEVVSAGGGSVARWRQPGALVARERVRGYVLNDGLISPSGAVLVATERGLVARLDAADPWRMAGYHGRAAFALALSPDGEWVASGGTDGRVAVWSVSSSPSTPAAAWDAGVGWVTALAWSSGGPSEPSSTGPFGLVSAADDGTITRWRWPQAGKANVVDCGLGRLISLALDGPDFVAGSESGGACHGRLDGSPPPRTWTVSEDPVMAVALSADRVFTSASAGVVRVWDVTNGALVANLAPTINRSPP